MYNPRGKTMLPRPPHVITEIPQTAIIIIIMTKAEQKNSGGVPFLVL